MTNRQIAGELVLGEATVKTHVHAVLRKLGVDRRDQVTLADLLGRGRIVRTAGARGVEAP